MNQLTLKFEVPFKDHLRWYTALREGYIDPLYVADTPFGPIHLEGKDDEWKCIRHPIADYSGLGVVMDLEGTVNRATNTYYRCLVQAIEEARK